jgi:hypothetical protein
LEAATTELDAINGGKINDAEGLIMKLVPDGLQRPKTLMTNRKSSGGSIEETTIETHDFVFRIVPVVRPATGTVVHRLGRLPVLRQYHQSQNPWSSHEYLFFSGTTRPSTKHVHIVGDDERV